MGILIKDPVVETPPETTPPAGTPPGGTPPPTEAEEEIVIPEHKTLFGDKFKTYQGFAKSYKEVEQHKSKLENQIKDFQQQIEDYESQILDMQDKMEKGLTAKPPAGAPENAEELERIKEEFAEELRTDPLKAIGKIMQLYDQSRNAKLSEVKKKEEAEKYKKEYITEEKKYKEKYGEKWNDVKKELAIILKDRPNITSLRDLVAIWKDLQEEKEEQLLSEQEKKDREKTSARSETGGGKPPLPKDVLAQINNASSMQELVKIGQQLKASA